MYGLRVLENKCVFSHVSSSGGLVSINIQVLATMVTLEYSRVLAQLASARNIEQRRRLYRIKNRRGLVEALGAWHALRPYEVAACVQDRGNRHGRRSDSEIHEELAVPGKDRGPDALPGAGGGCHFSEPLQPEFSAADGSFDELEFGEVPAMVDAS